VKGQLVCEKGARSGEGIVCCLELNVPVVGLFGRKAEKNHVLLNSFNKHRPVHLGCATVSTSRVHIDGEVTLPRQEKKISSRRKVGRVVTKFRTLKTEDRLHGRVFGGAEGVFDASPECFRKSKSLLIQVSLCF